MTSILKFCLIASAIFSSFGHTQQTYTDPSGFSLTCTAAHAQTGEIVPVIGVNGYAGGHWGLATYRGDGWPVMIFDVSQLMNMPPIMTRFTYYHECAHLAVPTWDEVRANCIGLNNMRLAGHISKSEEQIVAQITSAVGPLPQKYGGSGLAFWEATVQCAGE
jgi:hypothetical protein